MKKTVWTTLISALMVSSTYAQSFEVPSKPEMVSATGVVQVGSDMSVRYVTPLATDFVASSLIGADVYNIENENIGEVKDIILRENNIAGFVIAVGGFLGIGESYVVVSPKTIQMTNDYGKWKLITNATKDSLKDAPTFKYEGHWAR
ncbi:PRC-barrel domain-containing protein [Bartonella krasnovii]|uniref:PRC-barrel domain-containing protein n=1 Tax=Bartonella krasnovii TaxID=2267275 RepID=A0A5B9D172_9HYPH|nr:PRC-barrel domain-containing protein [Bartonella krasnovii]QEE11754.1 PRC-barrel domain containing protein [Bartonella krasnovii]UNF29513.1 PRC-barrel domain-containing protein [Bartonella krasnovii]UNF35871.1 PRC-barrel domain-containing protein [Bartonella krasnovii]UNF37491.1 PRC-barrel domain-containing protein [Bartonella krasnovii]UNF39275.1 PRC-barrel domain-containing protein [Bartonella krasnovii]